MADTFVECLVARETPAFAAILKIALVPFGILCFLLGLMSPIFLVPFVISIVGLLIVVPRLNVEFEYTFLGDQLNVDKILNKAKRKKQGEYEMARVDVVAPLDSREIQGFYMNPKNKSNVLDYSSKTGNFIVFGMIYNGNKEKKLILFEPNEKLINAMKYQSPNKVKKEA